ncbi:MAG: hypothetical protein ACI4R8_00825 [Candidatus Caccovivens sp.]
MRLARLFFSSNIFSSKTLAGSSLGSCFTNLPFIAKTNTLSFALSINFNKIVFLLQSCLPVKDLSCDEAMKYINSVDSFIYLCAKYMASFYVSHSRVPYAKIDKNKDYKKVYSILCGLEPKVKRFTNNPYSLKSYDNLLRLGKYICENIRWKIFKVGLTKKRRKILSFY